MASQDDDHAGSASDSVDQSPVKVKKRRLHGACDACRKKKVKCDTISVIPIHAKPNVPWPEKATAQRCPTMNAPTAVYREFIAVMIFHGSPRHINLLEQKIEKLQHFIQTLYPGEDVDKLVDDLWISSSSAGSPASTSSTAVTTGNYSGLKFPLPQSLSKGAAANVSQSSRGDSSDSEDIAHVELTQHMNQLSLKMVDDRFFGQSSVFMFFKHTARLRQELTGGPPTKPDVTKFRRPLFWDTQPWEWAFATLQEPAYVYPEHDLLLSLVSLYFEKVHPMYPLLHQPTFRRMLMNEQHRYDQRYGMTVLLVCALGARYSQDPRVLMPGDSNGFSAGWRYFCQVPMHRNYLFHTFSLFDLQYYALALIYFNGTGTPNTAWHVMGLAMRLAMERGAHRRKPNMEKPTIESELTKRAFWCMFVIDRWMASFLGRPPIIQDEDYDVDYPIECDDEYWEADDPSQAFQQPPGKPCSVTAFVLNIKLCETLGFALRTLYSTKKSQALSGLIGDNWESRIVSELDSAMTKWRDKVPQFLRWDPQRQDPVAFHQSVSIHATYYYVQIMIHRPFLSKRSPLSFQSLAKCTNAARSCAHMLEASLTRGVRLFPNMMLAAVSSGLIISLNLWGNRHTEDNPAQELANLERCVNFLRTCEKRWHMAGRMCDMLSEVASITDYQPTINKRRRNEFESAHATRASPAAKQTVGVPHMQGHLPSGQPPAPLAHMAPGFPMAPEPAPAMSEWDLTNLLLAQMNYMQANSAYPYQQQLDTGYHGPLPVPAHSEHPQNMSGVYNNGNGLPAATHSVDDPLAIWWDIPSSFTREQWESYLASVGQA